MVGGGNGIAENNNNCIITAQLTVPRTPVHRARFLRPALFPTGLFFVGYWGSVYTIHSAREHDLDCLFCFPGGFPRVGADLFLILFDAWRCHARLHLSVRLVQAFKAADTNGDGLISRTEFSAMMTKQGSYSVRQLRHCFGPFVAHFSALIFRNLHRPIFAV